MRKSKSIPKALSYLVEIRETRSEDCVQWPYFVAQTGYGVVQTGIASTGAHRCALILATGRDPKGMHAAHSCANKSCVNPRHLRWATAAENQADRRRHGDSRFRRLTEVDVVEIRSMADRPRSEVAKDYGICFKTVHDIQTRKTHRAVDDLIIWQYIRDYGPPEKREAASRILPTLAPRDAFSFKPDAAPKPLPVVEQNGVTA